MSCTIPPTSRASLTLVIALSSSCGPHHYFMCPCVLLLFAFLNFFEPRTGQYSGREYGSQIATQFTLHLRTRDQTSPEGKSV